MSGSETSYTARFVGPEILEQGRANTITCPVYKDGAIVGPTATSSTLTVYNTSNNEVAHAGAVSVVSSVATCSITAAELAAESYSDNWRFEWALVIAGTTYTFRTDGALVYRRLYPVITDADLLRAHTDLTRRRPPGEASYQDYLDESWAQVESRLVNTGRRPWLIMSPSSLRDYHLCLTLALIFRDFATGGTTSAEWEMMRHYEDKATAAWDALTFPEASEDGTTRDPTRRTAGEPSVWLGSSYQRRYTGSILT